MPRWLSCTWLWLVMPLAAVAQEVAPAAPSTALPAERSAQASSHAAKDASRATRRELTMEDVYSERGLYLAQATPPALSPPSERIPVPSNYAPGPGPSLKGAGDGLAAPQPDAASSSVYVIAASHVIPFPASLRGADLARREQLQSQLDAVESELDEVEPERVNTTGPIAAMVIGYSTGFASACVALAAFRRAETAQNNAAPADDADEPRYRRFARGFGVGAVLGLALGVAGSIGLGRRRTERQDKFQEREELMTRRDQLRRQLGLALDMSPRDVQLGVHGRF